LDGYGQHLRSKPYIIVGNKMDVEEASANRVVFMEKYTGESIFPISCSSGEGLKELARVLGRQTRDVVPEEK
jgi:predicted GTPase